VGFKEFAAVLSWLSTTALNFVKLPSAIKIINRIKTTKTVEISHLVAGIKLTVFILKKLVTHTLSHQPLFLYILS